MINQLLHNKVVSRENLIEETHLITEKLVNAAQSFIKLYREYRNGVLSESELIDAVEPLNRVITCLFLEQSDLPYPPKTGQLIPVRRLSNSVNLIAGLHCILEEFIKIIIAQN